ncbi:MAG: DUF2933 domain-containing protein, partial [Chloroflexia bacterium]|nr:DUF2933 domain-containing protein [Chloroflexia bacterium]
MDLLLAALPFLVLLACPLAMVFCMRGRGSKASQPTQMEAAPQTREARIAAL